MTTSVLGGMTSFSNVLRTALGSPEESFESVFDLIGRALDASSVSECAGLWDAVEQNSPLLFLREKIPLRERAVNAVLRVCNALLNRLSETRDAKLRGRIFLVVYLTHRESRPRGRVRGQPAPCMPSFGPQHHWRCQL